MKRMKRVLSLVLAGVLGAGLLVGCSQTETEPATQPKEQESESITEETQTESVELMDLTGVTDVFKVTAGMPGDTVVGAVGTYEITAENLLYWLNYNVERMLEQYSMFGITELPWDSELEGGMTVEQGMLDSALKLAAYYRLIPVLAEEYDLTVNPDVVAELDAYMVEAEKELGSEERFQHYLWMTLLDKESFRTIYENGSLELQLQEACYGEGSPDRPTDAEVLTYAEEKLGYYRAKHILLLTKNMDEIITHEDGSSGYAPLEESVIAEKKAKADGLLAQLRAAEDPVALFDTLMQENSQDGGLVTNPDGYITYKGEMVPEFETTALALENGEISDVVESVYGYHIILRLPLDPENFREGLIQERMGARSEKWLEEYGVTTNEVYDQIDPSVFREKVVSLQATVAEELDAFFAASEETEEAESAEVNQ